MMLGLCKPLHYSPKAKYKWTQNKSTFLRVKHSAEGTSIEKGNLKSKRNLQHEEVGSQHQERAEKQISLKKKCHGTAFSIQHPHALGSNQKSFILMPVKAQKLLS